MLRCDQRPNRLDIAECLRDLKLNANAEPAVASHQKIASVKGTGGVGILSTKPVEDKLDVHASFKQGASPKTIDDYPIARRFGTRSQFEQAAKDNKLWEDGSVWTSDVVDRVETQMWDQLFDKRVERKYEAEKESK